MAETAHDVYTALQPSYILQNFLGLREIKINGPPEERIIEQTNNSSARRIITNFLFIFILIIGTWVNYKCTIIMRTDDIFYNLTTACLFYGDILVLWSIVLCSRINNKILTNVWQNIFKIDTKLKGLNIVIEDHPIKWWAIIWITISFLNVSPLIYFNIIDDLQLGILGNISSVLYIFNNIYKTWLTITLKSWLYLLKMRHERISEHVYESIKYYKNHSSTKDDQLHFTLTTSHELHEELILIGSSINKIYSIALLIDLYYNFVLIILNLLYTASIFYLDDIEFEPHMIFTIFALCFRLIDVISLVIIGSMFITKANSIKRELLSLTRASNDEKLKKELNAFALQLLHDDVKITAGGFFTVDLPLIFTMVGAASTYLIILIQFDLAAA